jgi:hypothetical protein
MVQQVQWCEECGRCHGAILQGGRWLPRGFALLHGGTSAPLAPLHPGHLGHRRHRGFTSTDPSPILTARPRGVLR